MGWAVGEVLLFLFSGGGGGEEVLLCVCVFWKAPWSKFQSESLLVMRVLLILREAEGKAEEQPGTLLGWLVSLFFLDTVWFYKMHASSGAASYFFIFLFFSQKTCVPQCGSCCATNLP